MNILLYNHYLVLFKTLPWAVAQMEAKDSGRSQMPTSQRRSVIIHAWSAVYKSTLCALIFCMDCSSDLNSAYAMSKTNEPQLR